MHILLVHQAFAALDEAGGTRHHELAHYLVQRGHTVTIIASPINYLSGHTANKKMRWVERQSGGEGIDILRVYTYPALHRSFFHRLISFFSFMISSFIVGLGVRHVDLVWGTSPPLFQVITAWLLARLKRVPFIFEVRDLWPAFAIEVGVLHNPLLIHLSLWLERFLYSHADRVMVNSPGYVQHVQARGAKQVDLIPNGVDAAMFTPSSRGTGFRAQHHLDGKFVIMYAGAHGMSNDLQLVLKAADLLRAREDLRFVLVGDGKEKPALQAMANQMNLPNLLFIEPQPKNAMAEVMAAADACIAILKPLEMYKTTYPNKVFDYMAAGRPVILAIDGVIRQVVEDAGCGLAVQPGSAEAMVQAIEKLAQDPQKSTQMGMAGRIYVEKNFNRTDLAERLVNIFEKMRRPNG
jgi:glycosyltransferase involved in cell wall biosynthesis